MHLMAAMRTGRRYHLPLALAVAGLLAGCASAGPRLDASVRQYDVATDTAPTNVDPAAASGLLGRVSPSFVTLVVSEAGGGDIFNASPGRGVSSGSGYIVSSDGLALSAAHVGARAGYRVTARASNGRIYEGRVVALKAGNDISLIKLRMKGAVPVRPAASPCLRVGQPVFSLGRPRGSRDTLRIGSVKALSFGHKVRYGRYGYPDALVLRMNTRRGESGGPVFNERGELVAMVVSTLSTRGKPLKLAHAIPLPALARFYCAKAACGPRWRALAGTSMAACPRQTAGKVQERL
ncbi:MAG TPA: serine protease [Thermopetrobacter sp.]|nr:serine protease [Thermopetrobacter sp.]